MDCWFPQWIQTEQSANVDDVTRNILVILLRKIWLFLNVDQNISKTLRIPGKYVHNFS